MKKILAVCLAAMLFLPIARAVDPAVNVLISAIQERRVDMVSSMILANPQLAGAVDALGASVLHYAAECGDKRILQSVLGAKPNVNFPDRSGRTPIFRACERTLLDNMTLLLAHGAQPNAVDALTGMTPLMLVCERGKPQMAQALLAAGAQINAVNKNGTNALMFAAAKGNEKLITLLLGAGAAANAVDAEGNTALHYAARAGERDAIRLFATLINVKNKAGFTPMNLAMQAGHTKFVQEIAKYGGN